jgi:hypothetical protein
MLVSPEAQADNSKQEFGPGEELKTTQKWYKDTSFEGRTKAEFSALREEIRASATLDFVKLQKDRDYSRLIHENPLVNEFLTEQTLNDLIMIYEDRAALGISDEQFQKLLAIFGTDIVTKFREEIETDDIIKQVYKGFTPEELGRHSNETLATMRNEIELQEKNIPHPMLKPTLLPKKKNTH